MTSKNPHFYVFFAHMPLKHKILILCLLSYCSALSQPDVRSQVYYNKAMQLLADKKPAEAREAMKLAIKESPADADAYSTLGKWYYDARMYREAAEVFTQASTNCKNGHKAFAMPLVKSLLNSYNPSGALLIMAAHADDNIEWGKLKEQALFIQQQLKNPLKEPVINLGSQVNSPYPDLHPWISSDTQILYLTRRVKGIDEDMFVSLRDTICGGWLYAHNMGTPPNTSAHEGSQMISADNHYLFFTRCDNRSELGWDRGGCDLYMAYTGDSIWSVPQSFGATINTPAYEGMPCLSADNRMLYYASDRPGGYGGLDIWMSEFKSGLWQDPVNLGPGINTPGNETAPFLHIDNNTLYFSSEGHTGMGGADLYYSRRINDTTWTAAKNMGYPINSTANEAGICITMDGSKAFISSDRDSVTGNFDIYETRLDASLKPVPVAIIKGFAYDSLGSQGHLNYAGIYIYDSITRQLLYHFVSNRGDGSYMITLPVGKSYTYSADRMGYMENTGSFSLDADMASKTLQYNIPLLPQGYQAPIHDSLVLTIHFVRNSLQLTPADKNNIVKALDPWLLDKNFSVMVNSYTDASGTPIINEQFSAIRANLVAEEIISLGIDPVAVSARGWGEANPVAPNDTEEHMDMNRRVEIVLRR